MSHPSRPFAPSPSRREHLRTPPHSPGMFVLPVAGGSSARAGGMPRRASVRVDVPDRLLRMTRFGLDFASEPGSGWWRQVEREMQALVDSHLPDLARDVQMRLDIDRLEVVLSYQLPYPPASEAVSGGPRLHRA